MIELILDTNFILFLIFNSSNCPEGYEFNALKQKCEDINECETGAATCDPNNQACFNLMGSYKCLDILSRVSNCADGYRYQARIDQCVGMWSLSLSLSLNILMTLQLFALKNFHFASEHVYVYINKKNAKKKEIQR
jgi:Calcium-binding EGF domain